MFACSEIRNRQCHRGAEGIDERRKGTHVKKPTMSEHVHPAYVCWRRLVDDGYPRWFLTHVWRSFNTTTRIQILWRYRRLAQLPPTTAHIPTSPQPPPTPTQFPTPAQSPTPTQSPQSPQSPPTAEWEWSDGELEREYQQFEIMNMCEEIVADIVRNAEIVADIAHDVNWSEM